MRSRTTFKKRQKELARQEKQRDKVARRLQRKMAKENPEGGGDVPEDSDEMESVSPSSGSEAE